MHHLLACPYSLPTISLLPGAELPIGAEGTTSDALLKNLLVLNHHQHYILSALSAGFVKR
jgi:hypothetical protein